MMHRQKKAGKQVVKYEAQGEVLEQKFAEIQDAESNTKSWINGT